MDNDDRQVGRVLSRREVLTILAGMGGLALLAACDSSQPEPLQPTATQAGTEPGPTQPPVQATTSPLNSEAATAVAASPVEASPTPASAAIPSCVVRPELTEGPYFVDEKLERSDIRSDPASGVVKDGALLELTFNVSQIAAGCTPLAGALVDVWHCDAEGVYSDVTDRSFSTVGQKFLRGYQVTDSQGIARFTTIFPGWYPGRAVHIHFKIRTDAGAGQSYEFISQLFFDDSFSDQVYAQPPYSGRGQRSTLNSNDGIYRNGGSQLLINPTSTGQGYAATFDIGLQIG